MLVSISLISCSEQGDASSANAAPTSQTPITQEAIEKALAAAQDYFLKQRLTEAQLILRTLIEREPREYRAHELLGQVLLSQAMQPAEEPDARAAAQAIVEAYEEYRQATQLIPNQVDPTAAAGLHQSAGEIASIAGRLDDALDHFQRAAQLDPTNPKHPLYQGQILLQKRMLPEARRALERVLIVDPNEAYAHASLAMIALEEDNEVKAIEHIAEARQIDPNDLSLRIQEARVRRLCNQPRRALELLVLLTDQERAEEVVASEIASCYRQLGQPTKAAQAWQHRYQLRPEAWQAAAHAAEAYFAAQQRDEALWWYERARLAAPNSPQVRALEKTIGIVMDGP